MSFFVDIIIVIISVVACGIAVVLWAKVRKLEIHQNGLYQEISALALANKRLIERIKKLEQTKASPVIKKQSPAKTGKIEKKSLPEGTQKQESLWQDIIFLAKQGLSADTIARDLSITRGEVELILGLHKFKPEKS